MPKPSKRLQQLTDEFDTLLERLHELPNLEERMKLLVRMRILVEEIDILIFSPEERLKPHSTISH